jgi:hypothetical protein
VFSHLDEKDVNLMGQGCPVHPLKVNLKKKITDKCDETCNEWMMTRYLMVN